MATATATPPRHGSRACSATRPRASSSTAARPCRRSCSTCPGPDFVDRVVAGQRPQRPRAAQPADPLRPRPPGRHRLPLDPARRPGHRALRRARRSRPTRRTSTARSIVELAVEGGCNAVASTFGVLGSVARRWAHRIPFIVKLNHNELLTYPNRFDQVMFGTVAAGLGHGRRGRRRHHLLRLRGGRRASCRRCREAFARGPRAGHGHGALVLPAQHRLQEGRRRLPHSPPTSPARPTTSASPSRPTSSSRSCPTNNGGFTALNFGKTAPGSVRAS